MSIAFSALYEALSELRSNNDEKDSAVEVQRRSAIVAQGNLNSLRRRLGFTRELTFWISGIDDSRIDSFFDDIRSLFGDERYIEENEDDAVPVSKVREIFGGINHSLCALHNGIEGGVIKSEIELGRSQRFQFLMVGISCVLSTLVLASLAVTSELRNLITIALLSLSLLANFMSLKATLTELRKLANRGI